MRATHTQRCPSCMTKHDVTRQDPGLWVRCLRCGARMEIVHEGPGDPLEPVEETMTGDETHIPRRG